MAALIGEGVLDVKANLNNLKKDFQSMQEMSMRHMISMQNDIDKRMGEVDKSVNTGFSGMTRGVSAFANEMAAAFSFGEIKQAFDTGIQAFKGFEDELTKLGNVDIKNVGEIKTYIESLNPELGKAKDLTSAYYQVVSSGIRDQEAAAKALEDTARATAALNDVGVKHSEVIKVTTGLMANYPKDLAAASDALDLLFQIENRGKTTTAELIPVMGEVGAIAFQVGVSANEMAAALANTTQIAGSTAQAATGVKAVFTAMLKPTKDMKEVLEGLGMANAKVLVEQEGLAGALKLMDAEAQKHNKTLVDLFGSQEAIIGVTALQKDGYKLLEENIVSMTEKTGKMDDAYKQWYDSYDRVVKAFEATKDKLWREFGERILPIVVQGMEDFINFATQNQSGIEGFFDIIGTGAEAVSHLGGRLADLFKVLGMGSTSFSEMDKALTAWFDGAQATADFLNGVDNSVKALNPGFEKQQSILKGLQSEYDVTVTMIDNMAAAMKREMESGDADQKVMKSLSDDLRAARTHRNELSEAIAKQDEHLNSLIKKEYETETATKNMGASMADAVEGTYDLDAGLEELDKSSEKTSGSTAKLGGSLGNVAKEAKLSWGEINQLVDSLDQMGRVTGTVTYDIDFGNMSLAEQVRQSNLELEAEFETAKKMAEQYAADMVRIGEAFSEADYDIDYGPIQSRADMLQAEADEMNRVYEAEEQRAKEHYEKLARMGEQMLAPAFNDLIQGMRGDWDDLDTVALRVLNNILDKIIEIAAEWAAQQVTEGVLNWITSHVGTADTHEATYKVTEGQMILPESISDWIRDAMPSLDEAKAAISDYFGFSQGIPSGSSISDRIQTIQDYAPAGTSLYAAYQAYENGDYARMGAYATQAAGQAASAYGSNIYGNTSLETLNTVSNVGGALTSVAGTVLSTIDAVEQFNDENYIGAAVSAVNAVQSANSLFSYIASMAEGATTAAAGTSTASLTAAEEAAAESSSAAAGGGGWLGAAGKIVGGAGIGAGAFALADYLTDQAFTRGGKHGEYGTVGAAIGGAIVNYASKGNTFGAIVGGIAMGAFGANIGQGWARFGMDEWDARMTGDRTWNMNSGIGMISASLGGSAILNAQQAVFSQLNADARAVNSIYAAIRDVMTPEDRESFERQMAGINTSVSTYGGRWYVPEYGKAVEDIANTYWNEQMAYMASITPMEFGIDYESFMRYPARGANYFTPEADYERFVEARAASTATQTAAGDTYTFEETGFDVVGGAKSGGVVVPNGEDGFLAVQKGEGIIPIPGMEFLNSLNGGDMIGILSDIRDALRGGQNITVRVDAGDVMKRTANTVFAGSNARGINDGRPENYRYN